MPALTDHCYDCGLEYVPMIVDDGRCPDCDSPATPLVGEPTVLDVRQIATLDATSLPEDDAIEVLVRDDTDRLLRYAFAVPPDARPYAIAITFADVTIGRGDDHWGAIDGPYRVAAAVAEYVGRPPGQPPDAPTRRSSH